MVSAGLFLALGLLVVECALYLSQAAFVDHIESSVLIVGWQYIHGMPMYGIESGAPHFATYYGPLAYLAALPGVLLFGPGITSAKLVFVLAPLAALAILARHVRQRGPASARATLLLLTSGLLSLGVTAYWLRPDPLEMLLVTAAVVLGAGVTGAFGVGICLGLAVNLKVHAFLYFAPVLFDLLQRRGWRHAALAIGISIVVFLLPFLAHGISLADYRFALAQQVGARSIDPHLVVLWLYWSLLLAVPLIAGLTTAGPDVSLADRRYTWAAIVTLAVLGYPATFPGAGPYHLMPLIPVLADAFGRLRPRHMVPVLAPIALFAVGVGAFGRAVVMLVGRGGMNAAAQEAVLLADSRPGVSVQVGYGHTLEDYELSQLSRTLLSLHGRPALIDGQVLMELAVAGIDGSQRWIPLLRDCRVVLWVIPRGEEPFTLGTFYNAAPPFDAAFRTEFHAAYRLEHSGPRFDVWECDGRTGDMGDAKRSAFETGHDRGK